MYFYIKFSQICLYYYKIYFIIIFIMDEKSKSVFGIIYLKKKHYLRIW